jgi:hypothetical protein
LSASGGRPGREFHVYRPTTVCDHRAAYDGRREAGPRTHMVPGRRFASD